MLTTYRERNAELELLLSVSATSVEVSGCAREVL